MTKQIISNSLRTGIVKSCGSANCKSTTNYKDLTVQRFGRLQAITFYSKNKKRYCICDCGKQNIVRTANLTSGQVRSCGCLARDIASRNAKLKRLPEGISARNTVVNGYKKVQSKLDAFGNCRMETLIAYLRAIVIIAETFRAIAEKLKAEICSIITDLTARIMIWATRSTM